MAGRSSSPLFPLLRSCARFREQNAPKIDYKDMRLLSRYISERGKIVPSRITAVSASEAACACSRRSSAPDFWASCPTSSAETTTARRRA